MRLRQIELYGYKSFASRCAFEFSDGITAIVGPNGSGKSNIADAVRWVMGERSLRKLRARSTEDIIFAGSRRRARLGMAEVVITLDNSDGWLPVDYTEVSLGRRAYRSAENEYLLNGRRVRYREIVDLLDAAGLACNSYTVIGQGMVDAALALRPEARRGLFEEAAGIAPHLRKRAQALKRIEDTERNLERISDILNELHPRASRLGRQAQRAEDYLLLRGDLQELQRIWYGYQWQRVRRELARAEARARERKAHLESQRVYAQGFGEKRDEVSRRRASQRELLETLRDEEAAVRDDAEALRREAAVIAERTRLYGEQEESLNAELRSLASRRDALRAEMDRGTRELEEQEAALAISQDKLGCIRKELCRLDDSRRPLQRQLDDADSLLSQAVAAISDGQARLQGVPERRAELAAENQAAAAELSRTSSETHRLEGQGERVKEKEKALARTEEGLRRRRSEIEDEIAAAREQMDRGQQHLAKMQAERDQLAARREVLSRLRQERAGYPPGARVVLSARDKLSGVLGSVASLMDVPQEHERAIEGALGPHLHGIVTESWEDGEAAIAYLRESGAGRAVFFPLDVLRPRPPLSLDPDPDIVGVASALIGFEERLRPVFELLLGRVVIVRDLPAARRLGRSVDASLFVTLEGDTVRSSGVLGGGSQGEAVRLLAQEHEWGELPEDAAATQAKLEDAARSCATLRRRLEGLQSELESLRVRLVDVRAEWDAARDALADYEHDLSGLRREHEWEEVRVARVRKEADSLAAREERLRDSLSTAHEHRTSAAERLRQLREQLVALGGQSLRAKAAELETRLAVGQRAALGQRELLSSHESSYAQISGQIQDKQAQRVRLHERLEDLACSAGTTSVRLQEVERRVLGIGERRRPAQREVARLDREGRDVERLHAQSLERLHEAEVELNRATLERDRVRDRRTALIHDIEADLGPVELPETMSHQLRLNLSDDIVELPHVATPPPGLAEETREIKARLRRLGNINPEAPLEYEQLLERQTFLQGQAADLRGAIAALHEVIQELDTIVERDFSLTVQRVDKAFGEHFRMLFGGGTARLELTDPENTSATGVDIIARPPGRRSQRLSLLSGGERALTGVALLFALLLANPVPFCFLDEVDATLDEANVRRFRELLARHAQSTQFVVITHNRYTVESAATVYGVAMGEEGVSETVSLELGRNRAEAEGLSIDGLATEARSS